MFYFNVFEMLACSK